MDPLLVGDLPAAGANLWELFVELSADRESGINGSGRIPLTSIESWMRINDIRLTPWEVSTIKAMDAAVLGVWHENRHRDEERNRQRNRTPARKTR